MESKAASIEISIFDGEGYPVAFPAVLDLETTYIFQITVSNLTKTRGGQPWEALLETGIGVSLDSWHAIDLLPYSITTTKFAPNQSVGFVPQVYIKSDYAGVAGKVTAKVFDAFDGLLAKAVKRFSIGRETSPYAIYKVSPSVIGGRTDTIYLNPALETTEDEVVLGGVAGRPPPPPSPPQPPPIDYSQSKPPPGLDSSSEPEPEPEFQGETVVGGRLG